MSKQLYYSSLILQDFETDVKFNLIKKTPEQCYNVSKTNLKQNLKTARK